MLRWKGSVPRLVCLLFVNDVSTSIKKISKWLWPRWWKKTQTKIWPSENFGNDVFFLLNYTNLRILMTPIGSQFPYKQSKEKNHCYFLAYSFLSFIYLFSSSSFYWLLIEVFTGSLDTTKGFDDSTGNIFFSKNYLIRIELLLAKGIKLVPMGSALVRIRIELGVKYRIGLKRVVLIWKQVSLILEKIVLDRNRLVHRLVV